MTTDMDNKEKNFTAIDKIIAQLSYRDWKAAYDALIKRKGFPDRVESYSLSDDTMDAIKIKNDYRDGTISEEEYKDYCLKWNLIHKDTTKIIQDVNKLINFRDKQVYRDLIQPIRIARLFGNEEPELPHVDEIMKRYGIGSKVTYNRMRNRIVDKIPETEDILIRRATRSDKGKKKSKDIWEYILNEIDGR